MNIFKPDKTKTRSRQEEKTLLNNLGILYDN